LSPLQACTDRTPRDKPPSGDPGHAALRVVHDLDPWSERRSKVGSKLLTVTIELDFGETKDIGLPIAPPLLETLLEFGG
jgi:hypothetical protein